MIKIILLSLICVCNAVQVSRPIGVALSKKVFYNPEKNFTCLDGTEDFPFTHVNDDFCDCRDGTDEPGTPACPNGVFHCTNAGHKPKLIPSSWVNDGYCDCCDGTDEYNRDIPCVNTCRDLGRQAREEALRMAEILSKGHQARQDLSAAGKRRKEERKSKLDELTLIRDAAEVVRLEKEAIKKVAEDAETAALEKYKSDLEEKKKLEENLEREEKDKRSVLEAFIDLDANNDGLITIEEIKAKWVFDSNKDGLITDEEAKFFLNGQDNMDQQSFQSIGWMLMKPHYSMLNLFKGPAEAQADEQAAQVNTGEVEEIDRETATGTADIKPQAQVEDGEEQPEEDGEDEEDDDNEDDEEAEAEADAVEHVAEQSSSDPVPSVYDEETQHLIDVATSARNEYEEANRKVGDLDREIKDVKQVLDIDFGEDDRFGPMYSQCVEHEDREYIYKLCFFDLVSQRSKSGGSDVNLGRWQGWTGPADDLYSRMKYDHGLSCWNGPARSTEVRLTCGAENKLISVSEPNKCVYHFELETPAVCPIPSDVESDQLLHEEL